MIKKLTFVKLRFRTMLAIDYSNPKFESGQLSDSKSVIKDKFVSQKIAHLPIVDYGGIYAGLLYEEDASNWPERCESKLSAELFCRDYQHVYEAIEAMHSHNVSCMPIIDDDKKLCGALTANDLMSCFFSMAAVSQPGAVIVLNMPARDYSLSQISQIVESNGAKITSLQAEQRQDSSIISITIKINTREAGTVLETLRRYGYNIVSHFLGNDSMGKFYQNRIDELLRFINT
jgi:acetoin utilization protein AcuB